jgi:hypothetical protein
VAVRGERAAGNRPGSTGPTRTAQGEPAGAVSFFRPRILRRACDRPEAIDLPASGDGPANVVKPRQFVLAFAMHALFVWGWKSAATEADDS